MLSAVLSTMTHRYEVYFPGVQTPPRILSTSMEHRRLSDVARVRLQLERDSAEIYIKFHKHPHSPEERVRRKAKLEYETLKWLSEAFAAVPGCSVVRPIAYFSEYKAVVTHKAEGTSLYDRLNRPLQTLFGVERTQLEGWCYRAGDWLKRFQELTARPEQESFEPRPFQEDIERVLERCETLGFSRLFREKIIAWLLSELVRTGQPALTVTGQHPDFQPQNILVGPSGITVLDFTSFRYGNRYHDVASFMAWLDSRSKHPFFRTVQITRLQANFLQGYGVAVLEDPLLRLYRLKALLHYCATFLTRRPGPVGSQAIVRRFFLRWVEQQAIPRIIQ